MAWTKSLVRSDGSKRYKVFYSGPDSRKHSKTFMKAEDARQFARDIENAKRAGEYLDPRRARITLATYWPTFIEQSPHLRPTTRELYEGLWRLHINPFLGHCRLPNIQTSTLNSYVARLNLEGRAAPTINAAFRLVRTILSAAEADGLIAKNPARANSRGASVKLPELKRQEMRHIDAAQVHQLAREMPDRYQALVLLLGFCGLRVGEALALRVGDLDLLRRRANIARTLTELSDGRLLFGEPKTKQSRRSISLPTSICDSLAQHLAQFPPGDDGLVFTNTRGGPIKLKRFRRTVWRPAVRRADLEPLRIHDLRHSCVSISVAAGAHPKQIQALLGHSSITVTFDRYGHVFESLSDELAARVDEVAREAAAVSGANPVPVETGKAAVVILPTVQNTA
jgi:integrase